MSHIDSCNVSQCVSEVCNLLIYNELPETLCESLMWLNVAHTVATVYTVHHHHKHSGAIGIGPLKQAKKKSRGDVGAPIKAALFFQR